ncbi:MAG: dihydropteroate synthase [Clostridia bacterium]|nr:dihydropteroate synthase [Clostridia bacterium]
MNKKTYVMGILNITPDSFSDGGKFFAADCALKKAQEIEKDGADILDIGAQSTRPGAELLPPEEEIKRLEPILKNITEAVSIPVSLDTFYPEVVSFGLENGVKIINDVSGEKNPDIAKLVKEHDAYWIVTHNTPDRCGDIIESVRKFFEDFLEFTKTFSIDDKKIIFDVGIGFNKTDEENLRLLVDCGKTKPGDIPLLVGASNKRVIGNNTGETVPANRLYGTIAAHTQAIMSGADIIRVHQVAPALQAAKMADAMRRINNG